MTEPKSTAKKAETKEAPVKKAAPSRKEQLAADHPVARSGLTSVTHDEANPAFAIDTSK